MLIARHRSRIARELWNVGNCDISRVHGYDQAYQRTWPEEPRSKKAYQVPSNVTVLFFPDGKKGIRNIALKKRPESHSRNNQSWLLYRDNAPAHTPSLGRNFLAKNNTAAGLCHRIHRTWELCYIFAPLRTEKTYEKMDFYHY